MALRPSQIFMLPTARLAFENDDITDFLVWVDPEFTDEIQNTLEPADAREWELFETVPETDPLVSQGLDWDQLMLVIRDPIYLSHQLPRSRRRIQTRLP